MQKVTRRKAIQLTLAAAAAASIVTAPRNLAAQEANAQVSEIEAIIARIEGPQSPDQKKPDPQKPDPKNSASSHSQKS